MIAPPEGTMDLAQARLSARFGSMADEILWSRIGSTRELGAVFDLLRTSPLSRWVHGILADDGAHAIEAALRGRWRAEVDDVLSWMPPAWQPAVRWCRTWFDRPILHYLASAEQVPAWFSSDPAFREPAERNDATVRMQRVFANDPATDNGCVMFLQQVPDPDASGLADLLRLLREAEARAWHRESSMPGRKELRHSLVMLFRRTMLEPVAAFAYLAITAIDMERLRGELLRSAVFASVRMVAST